MGRDFTFRGKSQGLCLLQLCSRYRLVSATWSPYHQYWIINEAASLNLKVNGPLCSCLLIIVFEIGRLIDIWKPSTLYVEYRMGGFCLYCKWNGVAWKGVCRVAAEMFAFASLQKEKRRKKWMTLTLADHRVWSPSPAATIGGWTSLLTALQVTLSSTSAIALRQEAWD